MNIRNADTYNFNALVSRHAEDTQTLALALASHCGTLRAERRAGMTQYDFLERSNMDKLGDALWRASWRLSGIDDAQLAALSAQGNLHTVASVLGEWLIAQRPSAWVSGIHRAAPDAEPIPGPRVAYCVRRLIDFGRAVIDARTALELELAVPCLIDAANSIGADVLVDVLLKRATVEIRHPVAERDADS